MRLAFNLYETTEDSESPSADNKTILILHGLFGSKRSWQSIARQLSEQFKVITLDLRNHVSLSLQPPHEN